MNVDGVGGYGRPGRTDILILEEESREPRLLSTGAHRVTNPLWDPSGDDLAAFQGDSNLFGWSVWSLRDGVARQISESFADFFCTAGMGPDGRVVIWRSGDTSTDLLLVDLDAGELAPLLTDERSPNNPSISPDGRWLLYDDLVAGSPTVWLAPFPDVSSRDHVPLAQGEFALWNPEEGEIFITRLGTLLSLEVRAGSESVEVIGDPREILSGPYFRAAQYARPYDYDARNDRFLAVRHRTTPKSLVVVHGLEHELRRLSAVE